MNLLWRLKSAMFATVGVLLAAVPGLAQQAPAAPSALQATAAAALARTGCPEPPLAGAAIRDARVAAEAQMAQPQSGGGAGRGGTPYSTQARTLASARVQTVCVPDFRGMTLDQAKAAIDKTKGLHLESATPPNGLTVTAQNPVPFRYVPVGTGVTLQLTPADRASHWRVVPDITRMDVSLLPAFLERAGLAYGGSKKIETKQYSAGTIIQSPLAGTRVEEYTPVFRFEATVPPLPQPQENHLELDASPHVVVVNEQVDFEAVLATAVPGAQYQFQFGDGRQTGRQDDNKAQHQYDHDGTFKVKATAVLPSGEELIAEKEVRVHTTTWTVDLELNPRRADTKTPISFQANLLPPLPLPERPQYLFYFDNNKQPVTSNNPIVQRRFADAGTHFAHVVVTDADGHSFESDVKAAIIDKPPPPVWLWVLSAVAAGAISWLGGLKIAQKITTGRLQYALVADTPGQQSVEQPSGSAVEAGFEFQVVHPPLDPNAQCAGPIIKRVERLL